MTNLHTYIEHTYLSATATPEDMVTLCNEAKKYNFYGVCVNSAYVYLVVNELKNHPAKVISTIGFPLGMASTKAKMEEVKQALKDGADEIDLVINLGFFKSQLTKSISEEIRAIKKLMGRRILKVIIETCYLSPQELKIICELVRLAGADMVKTSTGFGPEGALLEDVKLIRKQLGDTLGIKASGGIKTANQAIAFILAGATRIGTSNGVAIVYDSNNHKE